MPDSDTSDHEFDHLCPECREKEKKEKEDKALKKKVLIGAGVVGGSVIVVVSLV